MPNSSGGMKKKGLESRKSHSWWWESHVAPRNAKWLTDHLEEMEQHYKHMLNLIEGDGDSFAKKAEMYYQRRPELISHVEEFYRTYKVLAERYELLTGELRKTYASDLQSQGSVGSESDFTSTPPDAKSNTRSSGHRAAGFDFFLGSGRSGLDRTIKGDETGSISDSETESDASSLYSFSGISVHTAEEGPSVRTMGSEVEPSSDDKLHLQEQQVSNGTFRRIASENFDYAHSKMFDYEEELKMAKEKICLYEDEIMNLKMELQKSSPLQSGSTMQDDFTGVENGTEEEKSLLELSAEDVPELQETNTTQEVDVHPEQKIRVLTDKLKVVSSRLHVLDKEVIKLRKENKDSSENLRKTQDLLRMSQQEAATFKRKLESEKRQASKLQERIARYKASLTDREFEVRELKDIISDANRKYQLHAEISRLTDEKTRLEEKLRESEGHAHTLETQHELLERKLNDEIEHVKADVAEKTENLAALKQELDALKLKYETVLTEKDELNSEISARSNQIGELEKHLHELGAENERACKEAEELRSKVEELVEEVEIQKKAIQEGAEEKREAIRQLCFSLDHYRNGYLQLRQAFMGHKQHHVLAS